MSRAGRLARMAALALVILAAAPSAAQAFTKAIWGEPYVNGVNQFPIYRRLGVGIVEMDLNWSLIAPQRPRDPADPWDYSWPRDVNQAVSLAGRYHMRILLQVLGSPPWANGGHPWNWAPNAREFATFAGAAARRYRSVHLWMIWGEPNRTPNFEPEATVPPGVPLTPAEQTAPHDYARILDAAYGQLKRISQSNLVIGGSTYTTGNIDTQEWIENLRLPDGRPPRMDMYAHNPFSWRLPEFSSIPSPDGEVMFSDLKRLGGWIDRYLRPGIPIFISEFTIPTGPDQEFGYYVDPQTQATWITDALRSARSWPRIYGLGWIHVYDDPPVSYGGLLTAGGTPKPGFYAFEHG